MQKMAKTRLSLCPNSRMWPRLIKRGYTQALSALEFAPKYCSSHEIPNYTQEIDRNHIQRRMVMGNTEIEEFEEQFVPLSPEQNSLLELMKAGENVYFTGSLY